MVSEKNNYSILETLKADGSVIKRIREGVLLRLARAGCVWSSRKTLKASPIFCEYESYGALFKALKDGNIDVMSVDVSILNGYVDSTTTILGDRFGGQHYGVAVKKENVRLLDIVNEVIGGTF